MIDSLNVIQVIFVFIFGSLIGSFLNVLIYRVPLGKNFVYPRSHCPHCAKVIPWYFNIPILSFLILRGKCHFCKAGIPKGYLAMEVVTGIIAVVLFNKFNLTQAVFYFNMICVFLCMFVIDIKHRIIPDVLNLYLFILFFFYALINYEPYFWMSGLSIGFGLTYGITWIFYKVKGVVGLGGGDIKLFGVLGLFLGPAVIWTLFLSSLLGSVGGIAQLMLSKQKDRTIAFGPYIIVTAIIQIFFPEAIKWLIPF